MPGVSQPRRQGSACPDLHDHSAAGGVSRGLREDRFRIFQWNGIRATGAKSLDRSFCAVSAMWTPLWCFCFCHSSFSNQFRHRLGSGSVEDFITFLAFCLNSILFHLRASDYAKADSWFPALWEMEACAGFCLIAQEPSKRGGFQRLGQKSVFNLLIHQNGSTPRDSTFITFSRDNAAAVCCYIG